MARNWISTSNLFFQSSFYDLNMWPSTWAGWGWLTDSATSHLLGCLVGSANNVAVGRGGLNSASGGNIYNTISEQVPNNPGTAALIGGWALNTWMHIAGTFSDASNHAVFRNGTKATAAGTAISTNTTAATCIGGGSGTLYWRGKIAFPAVWNVVLTDSEIAQLAKGLCPLKVRTKNLVHYLRMTQTGTTAEPDYKKGGTIGVTGASGTILQIANPRIYRP